MNWFNKIYSRGMVALQAIMILIWLICLKGTDSFYIVYVLCALLGIGSLWDNYRKRHEAYRWCMAGIVLSAVLFSGAVLLANYRIFTPLWQMWFKVVIGVIGGIITGGNIMLCLYNRFPTRTCCAENRRHPWYFFLIAFSIIVVIDMLFLFMAEYPGNFTPDSLSQLTQLIQGRYSNAHPFWHTMFIKLWVELGLLIFGEINAAVAFYNAVMICCMAACFAYGLKTLYEAGVSRLWLGIAFAAYAFLPYHISYSVTVWKDVAFGGAVLLFVITVYRLLKGIGKKQLANYILLALGAAGMGLWRSNGWMALLATLIVFAIFLWKSQRPMIILLAVMLVVTWILKGPLLNARDIAQPDLVEAMSIPEQQVARVISNGRELTEEQEILISRIIDIEKVPELYDHMISDPIKNEIRATDAEYFTEHKWEYFKLWIEIGLKYPKDYIKAWTDQTRGYWNGGYAYWIWADGVLENDLGIERTESNGAIAKLFDGYFDAFENNILLNPLISIGLHVWLVAVLFMCNLLKKRKEALLAIPCLAIVLTLLVATPVFSEFRYAYTVFTTLPIIFAVTVNHLPEKAKEI